MSSEKFRWMRTTPAIATAPPAASAGPGTSPSHTNATTTATGGTRYSAAVDRATLSRAMAYPQVTKPSADGSSPR